MLGHRGIRLGMTYPEIYEMQARAISEAKVAVEGRESRLARGDHAASDLGSKRTRPPARIDQKQSFRTLRSER